MEKRSFTESDRNLRTERHYSARDKTVRFDYVISLRVEGKHKHILPCKPKTLLPT